MVTYAANAYAHAQPGVKQELCPAGCALENPYVFDATARELHQMAQRGQIQIVDEHRDVRGGETLIDRISFLRLR
jgi:hypothetical protein